MRLKNVLIGLGLSAAGTAAIAASPAVSGTAVALASVGLLSQLSVAYAREERRKNFEDHNPVEVLQRRRQEAQTVPIRHRRDLLELTDAAPTRSSLEEGGPFIAIAGGLVGLGCFVGISYWVYRACKQGLPGFDDCLEQCRVRDNAEGGSLHENEGLHPSAFIRPAGHYATFMANTEQVVLSNEAPSDAPPS